MHRKSNGGFTLIEIVISMMFLSFGIMGVIALFFVGVNNGNLSIKNQKATIIALEVKDALINALKFPRTVPQGEKSYTLYRFEMPDTIDTAGGGPSLGLEDEEEIIDTNDDSNIINGFYLQISDTADDLMNQEQILFDFNAEEPIDRRVLDLPYEAISIEGDQIKKQVWNYRRYKFTELDSDYDEDDSHFYSFRIILRRSVAYPTTGMLDSGDLLVATVYVFKQYNETVLGDEEGKAEKTVFMDYVEDYGYPTFTIGEGEEVELEESIQPILKYEFYLPA